MNKICLFALSMALGLSAVAQTEDPVIMRVNGKTITRSEFVYSFSKNNSEGVLDKKTVEEYVPLYVNFKLKVAEAENQCIDTIPSIKEELYGYKEQIVYPLIKSPEYDCEWYVEKVARDTYNRTASYYGTDDLLTVSHILIPLRQDATSEQKAAAKARIDSVYSVLKAVPSAQIEEAFSELAQKVSGDLGSAKQGGALPRFGKGRMIPDFENAAYALKEGQLSSPVETPVGYHVIYMKKRGPFEPYEFHHDDIIRFLQQQPAFQDQLAKAYVDSIAQQQGKSHAEVVENLFQQIIAKDADLKNLSQEYYDGTLMYEVTKKDVWNKAQDDITGQEAYFKAHKKDYAWKSPRFTGLVIHAKDAVTMAKVKKLLKGVAEKDWAKTAVSLNNDSVKFVRVERGIFEQGVNSNVDKLVFKQNTELKPMKDYPVTDVWGKKLKAPRTAMDVKGVVMADYQNEQEKLWVESLRKKYPVEVFEDVVKTVKN